MEIVRTLDVRVIEPGLKQPSIFQTFDEIDRDEAFILVNDHDPKPLYYQLMAERPQQFSWKYLKEGPTEWQVEIAKIKSVKEATLGQLAAGDYRKAIVFKKFGLDFCCGGKKSITQAAEEKGIDKSLVEAELAALNHEPAQENDFNRWELSVLIDHIVQNHHGYIKENVPVLEEILHKVVVVHSENHPELTELLRVFADLQVELFDHLRKEEEVLFPYIKRMEEVKESAGKLVGKTGIKNPVKVMEDEHESVAKAFTAIRSITNEYTLPSGVCNSYRMVYGLLKDLEEDLIQHIHLENNILFPKAEKLESELM